MEGGSALQAARTGSSGVPGLSDLLELTEPTRPVPLTVIPDQPLISLAWRILSQEKRRLIGESVNGERRLDELLSGLAQFACYLEKSFALMKEQSPDGLPQWATRLRDEAKVIGELLEHHRVKVIHASGIAFEGELLEVFGNVGQKVVQGIEKPIIAEVIEPAILRNSALLHMGKAIIGMPEESRYSTTSETGQVCEAGKPDVSLYEE